MCSELGVFGGIGMQELLIILLIAVLIFGASRIPEIARSLGKSLREFKKGAQEVSDDIEKAAEDKESEKAEKTDSDDRKE